MQIENLRLYSQSDESKELLTLIRLAHSLKEEMQEHKDLIYISIYIHCHHFSKITIISLNKISHVIHRWLKEVCLNCKIQHTKTILSLFYKGRSEKHQIYDTNPPSWDDTQPEVWDCAPLSRFFLLSNCLFSHWTLPDVLFLDAFDYISATVNHSVPTPTGTDISERRRGRDSAVSFKSTPTVLTVHSGIWKTSKCSVTIYVLEFPLKM